jgi:hypothetical protein
MTTEQQSANNLHDSIDHDCSYATKGYCSVHDRLTQFVYALAN